MKIWVDGQCFQTASKMRGIGRYAIDFLKALAEVDDETEIIVSFNAAMAHDAIRARELVSTFVAPTNIHVWEGRSHVGEVYEGWSDARRLSETALVHHVNCLSPDIAFSLSPFEGKTDPAVPLLPHDSLVPKTAGIFYDAIPYRYADQYLDTPEKQKFYMRRLQACAGFDALLCISAYSKSEAQALAPGPLLSNVQAGISPIFGQIEALSAPPSVELPEHFALYVGGLDWRKNLEILPPGFSRLPTDLRASLDLVLIGDHPPHLLDEIAEGWRVHGLDPGRLHFTGFVADRELPAIYSRASIVVQPSLLEGFGLTALEALASGTPVAAARRGALPEVIPFEECLFDPESVDDFARCVAAVLENTELHGKIKANRSEVLETFSWPRSAEIGLKCLETIKPKTLSTPPHFPTLRQRVAPSLRGLGESPDVTARIMTNAEPDTGPSVSRLLIEVTNSVRHPANSGIQRVVRETIRSITAEGASVDLPVIPVFGDLDGQWYTVPSADYQSLDKAKAVPVSVGCGDIVLMLDSSWDIYHAHRPFLLEAKMRGASVYHCMYDLVPLWTPAFCSGGMTHVFKEWFLSSLAIADGYICISKAVADDLGATLHAMSYPRPIKVDYWPLGSDLRNASLEEPTAIEDGNTGTSAAGRVGFLMVGTLEPRKGHIVALRAFESLWSRGLDVQLTIVGHKGWQVDGLTQLIESHVEFDHRLHWHSGIDDQALQAIYRDTDVLIASSYAEGFGLPIVEAARMGKRLIASDIPVFREVAGDSDEVSFFSAGDPDALAKTVERVATQLRTGGQPDKDSTFASTTTWTESAAELQKRVVASEWRCTYVPEAQRSGLDDVDEGVQQSSGPLPEAARRWELTVEERLPPEDPMQDDNIIVCLKNLSEVPWFGRGLDDGRFAFGIGYRGLNADGMPIGSEHPRIRIPLVIPAGQSHYLPLTIPVSWRTAGATHVELEIVQEAVTWWGRPTLVTL